MASRGTGARPAAMRDCQGAGRHRAMIGFVRSWDGLSHEEQCLMVNAREHDLVPSVMWDWRTDLDFADRLVRYGELAEALIGLVDQGFIEVRRLFVDGDGNDRHEVISREQLPEILADPGVWQYTDRSWVHRDEGFAVVETPAGQRLSRTDRAGVPDPQRSNPHLR